MRVHLLLLLLFTVMFHCGAVHRMSQTRPMLYSSSLQLEIKIDVHYNIDRQRIVVSLLLQFLWNEFDHANSIRIIYSNMLISFVFKRAFFFNIAAMPNEFTINFNNITKQPSRFHIFSKILCKTNCHEYGFASWFLRKT